MYTVITQTAALILLGVLWRVFEPRGLEAGVLRHSLTSLVYVVLLPALALAVMWRAPLSLDAVRVAFAATFGLGAGLTAAWVAYRLKRPPRRVLGALLLAATFPNATYMGLPVLEATLGPEARIIALQYDMFACTPWLLTAGVLLAARFGEGDAGHPLRALLTVPPLWGALAGVALNAAGVPMPFGVEGLLEMLGAGVVPLMLFSLGLGLTWSEGWLGRLPLIGPVLIIQLLLTPLLVWGVSGWLGLEGQTRVGVVLEAAMPSMVLGIVLCDRYRLDTGAYAMAVTLTTALSVFTLPFWFDVLMPGT